MKQNYLISGMLMFLIFVSACSSQTKTDTIVESQAIQSDNTIKAVDGYTGVVLAGSASKYIAFNKADYEKARAENKLILLDFYAIWCPVCIEEQKEIIAAFDDLDKSNVIGFRINYKDSDTDSNEESLAKEFGIIFQHTKVIIKNGEVAFKALDSWDKERFLSEIDRFV